MVLQDDGGDFLAPHQVLQNVHITYFAAELPLYADLFRVRYGCYSEIRSAKRGVVGFQENYALSSVGWKWLRSRTVACIKAE